MTHTSGLDDGLLGEYGRDDDAVLRALAGFKHLRQVTSPGELWAYSNVGFVLAAAVVQRVVGVVFEAVIRERVFAPLGMTRSFYFAREAITYPLAVGHTQTWDADGGIGDPELSRDYEAPRVWNGAGGIISTVEDLLRFAALHLGDGTVAAGRVLSAEAIQAMRSPHVRAVISFAEAYGLGWALRTVDGVTIVGHTGSGYGFEARLTLVPQRQFALALLANSTGGDMALRDIERWALARFYGLHLQDPAPRPLSTKALARFAGHYRGQSDATVTVQGGGLRVDLVWRHPLTGQETRLPPMHLRPIAEQEFLVTDGEYGGSRIDFILQKNGRPRFMRMGGKPMERGDEQMLDGTGTP